MNKRVLSLFLVIMLLLTLVPTSAFAAGTTYAVTNGTPESDSAKNHGYIAIDKENAEEGEMVTISVNPDKGYKLKSLTAVPTPKTIADILPSDFPQMGSDIDNPADDAWEAKGTDPVTGESYTKQCYLSLDGAYLRFFFVLNDSKDIPVSAVVTQESGGYVYKDSGITITFTMSGEVLSSIEFAGNDSWNGSYAPPSACVAAGTMVTMGDGKQKAIEKIEIGDVIRTVDHETGTVSSAPVCFIWETKNAANAFTLTFEDNTEVTVIEEHGFYELEEKKYVFINANNAKDYVGYHFYNADNDSWLELTSFEMPKSRVDAYAIATSKHLSHLSNGMLSMCDGTFTVIANIFEHDVPLRINAEEKEKDITNNGGLTPLETVLKYKGFNEADYNDYNLQYLNVAIGKGLMTWELFEALSVYCEANNIYDAMPESAPPEEAPTHLIKAVLPVIKMLSSLPDPSGEDGVEIKAGEDGKYTFTMPGYAVTVTAEFEKALTSVDVPTAAEGLVYNGLEQTGVAENAGYTVVSGKATIVGNYTATAALAEGYCWSDGSTDAKEIKWSIAKATPYIKTNPAPSDITSGKKLADSTLAGGYAQLSSTNTTEIAGLFTWKYPDTVPGSDDSEVTLYDVTFTPADEINFNSVSCQVTITVNHIHNLVKVDGQAATETEAGMEDYYECDCGALFEDENGNVPIENLAAWKAEGGNGYIAPLLHSITPVNGKDAADSEAGYKPYYECRNCGKYYEDAEGKNEILNLDAWKAEGGNGYIAPLHGTDSDRDHICDACGKTLSECADENKDHKCDYCGKQISEHNAIPIEGKASTSESAGYKSYYKCDCGKFFEDAACKVEITDLNAWKAEGGNGYIAKLHEEPESPQTGDNSNMTFWVMLFALSTMGFCACLNLVKKRKNEQ